MKTELINHFTFLVNRLAECNTYGWSAEYKEKNIKEAFETFYKSLKKDTNKHLIDLQTLTVEQAKELRFGRWCSDEDIDTQIEEINALQERKKITDEEADKRKQRISNTKNLFLIPLWFVPLIPKGTELTTINGDTFIYNGDISEIDTDIRYGCVAYGIKLNK